MRKQLVSGKKLLLFVDTGDNCRCPLAIGYLSKLLAQKNIDYIELRHMGVMTPNDLLPTPEVVQLLKEEGVDIRYHRSRPINPALINEADLVLGFTAIHVQTCLRRVPESKGKVHLLKQYVGLAHTGDQIHDPMGSTMEIFKKYFNEIKQALNKFVEMEFVTEPPEPKEVVIAPTVSKPRRLAEEEEEPVRTSRVASEDKPKKESKPKKKAAAAKEDTPAKPAKKKAEPASKSTKAASAKVEKKADKPAKKAASKKASSAKTAAKPAKAKAPAKPETAKAKSASTGKTAEKASSAKKTTAKAPAKKAAEKKPAAKSTTAKTAATKTKTASAAAKAKPVKSAATKTAAKKPATKAKATAGKAAAKTSKSKK